MIKNIAKYVLAALFILSGVLHFVRPAFYLAMMPPYIPMHELMVMISGVCEFALGSALLFSRTARLAAWGLVALLFAVFPANLHMALNPASFPDMPEIGLWVRLPLQGVMIWWAWLYTR